MFEKGGKEMDFEQLQSKLIGLTKRNISQTEIGNALGITRSTTSTRFKTKSQLKTSELEKVAKYFDVSLDYLLLTDVLQNQTLPEDDTAEKTQGVYVTYRPEVYLSAGYGVEVYNEKATTMLLDESLFISDRGIKTDYRQCEIVRVSGNSMSPEYRHGDRVIIDKSCTTLSDGHIFAIRYKGECFIKEVNLLGNKIKCIPINKDYDPFYISEEEDFVVLGRILPRVRL